MNDAKLEGVYNKIKSIKIQGATKVSMSIGRSLAEYADFIKTNNSNKFVAEMKKAGDFLVSARATEPMAENVVQFLNYYLNKNKDLSVVNLKNMVTDSIGFLFEILKQNELRIIENGQALIKSGDHIFTHCHASTVIKILVAAKKKNIKVYHTETRPLYQGRITATELVKNKINDTIVDDSAAPFLISKYSNHAFKIDKVIIGCDAIAKDGSCLNKIGSFSIVQTAVANHIPVYIATQSLKIDEEVDSVKKIPIEERSAKEIWADAPKGLKILNPAFDIVPAEFIRGYICEFGIVKPKQLFKLIRKKYFWLN